MRPSGTGRRPKVSQEKRLNRRWRRVDPKAQLEPTDCMEEVCERENLKEALRQVKANKGSSGVDGMTDVFRTQLVR